MAWSHDNDSGVVQDGGHTPGSKEVLCGRPGQVDSPSGQVTFRSHLPNGQGTASHLPTKSFKAQTKTCLGRATCPKGNLEFISFVRTLHTPAIRLTETCSLGL